MEPNDPKNIQQVYMPQYAYPQEYQAMYPNEFTDMPPPNVPNMHFVPGPPQPMNQFFAQSQQELSYQQNIPQDLAQNDKMKGKRRSKNEPEGRNYRCKQCDKTYLSYPALYTHIKTKHVAPGTGSLHTGRGRGRPKKSVIHLIIINMSIDTTGRKN